MCQWSIDASQSVAHAGPVLTTGEEPPETEPAPPVDAEAVVDAGGPSSSMSWWTRMWVALFVALAVGMVASGVVLVRRTLDHTLDPQALQQLSTSRLNALDPALPGMTATGGDTTSAVSCEQGPCASAARVFVPATRTTAASVLATATAWASGSGLGSLSQAASARVGCGLAYAPIKALSCELATYDVPGQTGEQVNVFAVLTAGTGAGSSPGDYPRIAMDPRVVTAVYVQVLSVSPRP